MKNKINPYFIPAIFLATTGFFQGLLSLLGALDYRGLENNYVADNWEIPLVIFMILAFTTGWGIESFSEYMIMNGRRRMSKVLFLILFLLYCVTLLSSFFFDGFVEHALRACGFMLEAGYFYKLSTIHPEVVDKFKMLE